MTKVESQRRVIRASAGTGKTYRLSSWFLRQLFADARLDQLLATTFTRKAAREILDRILVRLAKATLSDTDRSELRTSTGAAELSQDRCVTLLTEMTQHLHRMRVGTLDSFFTQIATHCSLDLGLPPGWAIIDSNDDRQIRREAMELLLQDDADNNLIRLFHLVTVGDSNRSVTTLLEDAVDGAYSLFLESDQEAWNRFPNYAPLSDRELDRALDDFANMEIPITKSTKEPVKHWANDHRKADDAIKRGDWEDFIGTSLAEKISIGEANYSRIAISAAVGDLYRRLLEHARGVIVKQMADQTGALYCLLQRFDRFYGQLKEERRWLTYDDITRRLGAAVQSMDLDQVSYRLDSRIQHLMLDEFQDTSLTQWQILRPFAQQVCSTSKAESAAGKAPDDRSFFCVGDVKQAIYSWRGGVAEIFNAVEDELAGLTTETLELSYRSSQPVIDLVNSVFDTGDLASHPNLPEVTQATISTWLERFIEHRTAKPNLPGYCCLLTAPRAVDYNAAREDASGDDESGDLGQKSITIKTAADLVKRLATDAPTCSIGVLCKSNDVVAECMFELRQRGVDASEEGGNPLTDSANVQAIVSLLKLVDHPGNSTAAFHVATSPLGPVCGLTDFRDSIAIHSLAGQLRRQIAEHGLANLLESWSESLADFCSPRDARRLRQLIALARSSAAASGTRMNPFVELVENERVEDPSGGRIRVTTLHKSKGLEYDIVVLPELDGTLNGTPPKVVAERLTPTSRPDRVSIYRNKTIQNLLPAEFRNLFETWTRDRVTQSLCMLYVALTRAKHATYMVIGPGNQNAKSLPASLSGLLRWALLESADPIQPESTLFEVGNPDWFSELRSDKKPKATSSDKPTTETKAPTKIVLAEMPTGRARGLSNVEPSSLEGTRTVRINELLSLDRAERLERGTLLHRWFEEITWLDDGPPAEQRVRSLAGIHSSPGISIDDELQTFERFLAQPAIASALSRRHYRIGQLPLGPTIISEISAASPRLDVKREWGFAVPGSDGELVNGVIDRLVLIYHPTDLSLLAADIIDYKTDTVNDSAAAQQRADFYREQMMAYRNAVASLYRIPHERISARLLFVNSGDVCEIS